MSSSASSSSALSGALKALADNPLDFLTKHPIAFSSIGLPPEYRPTDGSAFQSGSAGIKLVRSEKVPANYILKFVAIKDLATDKEAVNAYVLSYKKDNRNDDVPYVEIPIKAYVENTFLFTVGLTGCSVIVTSFENGYRVFHDRRMDSSVLYNNVQMRVDYNDYRIGGRDLSDTGQAITLMLFKGGAWKMFMQRQLPNPDPTSQALEVYAVAVQQTGPASEKAFNDQRTIIQKRVKTNGKNLKVGNSLIDGAVDGIVQGVEYNEQAISGWKALRSAIQSKLDIYFRDPKKDPKLRDTYNRYESNNRDSAHIDETWIWLRIKKNRA